MFVAHSLTVRASADEVQRRLVRWRIEADLDRAAADAIDDSGEMTTTAGVPGFVKRVRVQTLEPYRRGETVVLPLRWVAVGPAGSVFPALDANLELWPAESGTQLVLVGSYRPPVGALGRALDIAGLHKIADVTVARFLRRIAEFVEPGFAQRDAAAGTTRPLAGTS